MVYSVFYQERALAEYEAAIVWYRNNSELAASNFELAVKEKIDILRNTPHLYHKSYKHFHEVALRKYPFSIVYIIDEKQFRIVISSIYHHKRSHKKKYRNL
jgi:plasmid stabilization system protein ParE